MKRDEGGGRALRVLVVDDHQDTGDMIAELLEAGGFAVRVCLDVSTALVALRREPHDALVTDLQLGLESGLELAIAARADASSIVLIAVTGTPDPDGLALETFDAYWLKPIDVDTFADDVKRLVGARHR